MPRARDLIEALDFPEGVPDLVHADKKAKLQRMQNPAFPGHAAAAGSRATNYPEKTASSRWKKLVGKINHYSGTQLTPQNAGQLIQGYIRVIPTISQIEAPHRRELERLAIEVVFELPEFKTFEKAWRNGELKLVPKIVSIGEVDLSGAKASAAPDEEEVEQENPEMEGPEFRTEPDEEMQKKIKRRIFSNAMIQGGAISNNYAFELGGAQLDRIDPRLRKLYGLFISATDFAYWFMPDTAAAEALEAGMSAGAAKVEQEEDSIPTVKATGINFPVVVQELIKGLLELASLHGLPEDDAVRREVIDKADVVDLEDIGMMLGPEMWNQFVSLVDSNNERDVAIHLYNFIQSMDDDEFNETFQAILSGTPEAKTKLRQLAYQIKHDMEMEDRDDYTEESMKIVKDMLGDE